jgi:hypothetical protein
LTAWLAVGIAMGLFCRVATAAGLPAPTERLRLEQSPLIALLEVIPTDDRAARWELANLTLEVMGEAYREALQASLDERPSKPSRRVKLARWQEATADLIRSIDQWRQRLLVGGAFTIYADKQRQIIVIVDGEPLLLAGLTHNDERMLEARIVARYCAFNDCPELQEADTDPATVALPAGDWLIRQDRRPLYRIDPLLHCVFDDLAERRRKASACRDIAQEMLQLRRALAAAQDHGALVSWPLLSQSRQTTSEGLRLILNDQGTWLTVDLPRLAQLPDADWRSVIEKIAGESRDERLPPLVLDGELLPGIGSQRAARQVR